MTPTEQALYSALQGLVMDLTNGFNKMPKSKERRLLVEEALDVLTVVDDKRRGAI
jgi:hypothetical protein